MSARTAPPALLVVGAESTVAQELLMAGLQQGFRINTARTVSEAMTALGQVLFDVVLFNPFACPELPRLVSVDPDLARVPFIGVVHPTWDEGQPVPETDAVVFEQGDELVAWIGMLQRRDPNEERPQSSLVARVDWQGGSSTVRLLEVRMRQLRVEGGSMPGAGTSVEVRVPWTDEVRTGSVATTDSRSATIAFWQD